MKVTPRYVRAGGVSGAGNHAAECGSFMGILLVAVECPGGYIGTQTSSL
jgi:hypothetical protein